VISQQKPVKHLKHRVVQFIQLQHVEIGVVPTGVVGDGKVNPVVNQIGQCLMMGLVLKNRSNAARLMTYAVEAPIEIFLDIAILNLLWGFKLQHNYSLRSWCIM